MSTISAGKIILDSLNITNAQAGSINVNNLNFDNLNVSNNLTVDNKNVVTDNFINYPVGSITQILSEFRDLNNETVFPQTYKFDGSSGPTNFQYCNQKVLATCGEFHSNGTVVGGSPDGMGAYLSDNNTVRVIYNTERGGLNTYKVNENVEIGGAYTTLIDYDRSALSSFMSTTSSAKNMVKDVRLFINKIYNCKGELVEKRNLNGITSKPFYGNTDIYGNSDPGVFKDPLFIDVPSCDWNIVNYGCSSSLSEKHQWGNGIGLENSMYFWNTEEGIISLKDNPGNPFLAVDLTEGANFGNTYQVPSMGGAGFEKNTEINTGHPNYVCFGISSYNSAGSTVSYNGSSTSLTTWKNSDPSINYLNKSNYTSPNYVVPVQIYIGIKNYKANGVALTSEEIAAAEPITFLARNGLEYGQIYGFAVPTATTSAMETFCSTAAPGTIVDGKFMAVPYRYDGNLQPLYKTSIFEWQDTPVADANNKSVHTSDYKFWNSSGSSSDKVEHYTSDPKGGQRLICATCREPGYVQMYDFTGLTDILNGLSGSTLPPSITAKCVIVVSYGNINHYTMYYGTGGGLNKNGKYSNTVFPNTTVNARNQLTVSNIIGTSSDAQQKIPKCIDSICWVADSTNDWLVMMEDPAPYSDGAAMFLMKFNSTSPTRADIYYMSQITGELNSSKYGHTIPKGSHFKNGPCFYEPSSNDDSSEYSGIFDLSPFILKNGANFILNKGDKTIAVANTIPIGNKLILTGIQQHRACGGEFSLKTKGLQGGQLIALKPLL